LLIEYPSTCVTSSERTAYLYRLFELLRLRHNEQGAKYRAGKLSKQKWDEFLRWFNPRHDLFVTDVLKARKQLKEDKDIVIDIDAVFVE